MNICQLQIKGTQHKMFRELISHGKNPWQNFHHFELKPLNESRKPDLERFKKNLGHGEFEITIYDPDGEGVLHPVKILQGGVFDYNSDDTGMYDGEIYLVEAPPEHERGFFI